MVEKINMKESIGRNLALRESADNLFDRIDLLQVEEIILDFKDVISISRSFSQQLLHRITKCPTKVVIVNKSEDIDSMFCAVKNPKDKYKLGMIDSGKIVEFNGYMTINKE